MIPPIKAIRTTPTSYPPKHLDDKAPLTVEAFLKSTHNNAKTYATRKRRKVADINCESLSDGVLPSSEDADDVGMCGVTAPDMVCLRLRVPAVLSLMKSPY